MSVIFKCTRRAGSGHEPLAERFVLQASIPSNGAFVAEILYIAAGNTSGYVVGAWQKKVYDKGEAVCVEFSSVGDRYIEHIDSLSEWPDLMRKGQALAELMISADPQP